MRHAVCYLVLALILVALAGCSRKSGPPSKSNIEAKLKEQLKLQRIALTDNPAGGYAGTATGEDGAKFELTVIYDEPNKTLRYRATDEKGNITGGLIRDF
jgi:hypothetical protein